MTTRKRGKERGILRTKGVRHRKAWLGKESQDRRRNLLRWKNCKISRKGREREGEREEEDTEKRRNTYEVKHHLS